jgi:methyl-accepting chemotaxis protein
MSRSLVVRFVLAGLVPLVAASALLFVQQQSAARDQARQSAHNRAVTLAGDLAREFQSWRTELLVAANNPALREWFQRPSNTTALRGEVNRALLQLNTLNPDLIDEACYISASGPELGRQVKGAAAPVSDLSPDESGNPFFKATLALNPGQVHQNAPYISPDSHRWVISNSTPVAVDGRKVAMLHFESNLDAIRVRLATAASGGTALRVVDSRTGTTIADSRSQKPILGQRLTKSSADPLPSGWQLEGVDIAAAHGDDNHWRVEVAVAPESAISGGLVWRLVGLVLIAAAALVFLARRSARAIVGPLRRLATVANNLANGDRASRVTVAGYDEMVRVGTAFNTMVDGLAEQDAQLLAAQAEREQHLAARLEHEQLAEQRLRERAQSAINETAGTVSEELRGLSAQVDVVRQGAATIDERVGATVEVIRAVGEQARDADAVVAELQASLREVDGMTQLIANVANQTKLLALNATIEAARAGTAGRGFSVVADEVKELATATGRSTERITETISQLNAHSGAVAEAIATMSGAIVEVGDASGVLRQVAEQQFTVVDALNAQVDDALARIESMSSVTGQLERRRHPRVMAFGPVQLSLAGRALTAELVDVSESGVRCRLETAGVVPGQTGTATFTVDGHNLSVQVRVVTSEAESGIGEVGFLLDGPPPNTTASLREFVNGHR